MFFGFWSFVTAFLLYLSLLLSHFLCNLFNERFLIHFSTGQPAQRLQLCGGNSAGELDWLSFSQHANYAWSPAQRSFTHIMALHCHENKGSFLKRSPITLVLMGLLFQNLFMQTESREKKPVMFHVLLNETLTMFIVLTAFKIMIFNLFPAASDCLRSCSTPFL